MQQRPLILLIPLAILIISCNKNKLTIDETIKSKFELNAFDTIQEQNTCGNLFKSRLNLNVTLNNEKYTPPSVAEGLKLFESKWRFKNDTINIFGTNKMPDGAVGFEINIFRNKVEVNAYTRTHVLLNNLANDSIGPTYNSIFIPSRNSNVILSKIPKDENDIIYGYLKFETKEFYTLDKDSIGEYKISERIIMEPEFIFKAKYCKE